MKKIVALTVVITMLLSLFAVPAFSQSMENEGMYASGVTQGTGVPVKISSYTDYHYLRLDPANALGDFDAVQTAGGMANRYFFGLAARQWTNYTFDDNFFNVDGEPDIELAEVTWGAATGWHAEATLVYLTGAYVKDSNGDIHPYEENDTEGIDASLGIPALDGNAYYAGIAGNRIAINYITPARKAEIRELYIPEDEFDENLFNRDFHDSTTATEGSFGITQFYLPDEVVYAQGITFIDITRNVYAEAYPSTYTSNATPRGTFTVNFLPITSPNDGDVTITASDSGNTDGFDLDAIRVYKCPPLYEISGYKINSDTGETVSGWLIHLDKWINGDWEEDYVDPVETDGTGKYCFLDLPMGEYRVREDLIDDDWEQVYPGGDGFHYVTLPTENIVYGIQRNTGKIFKVDPLTADADEVYQITLESGLSFSNIGPNGLAYDKDGGYLYFVNYPGLAKLYLSDTSTQEYLGNLPGEIACADFFDGKYYYIAGGPTSSYGGATDDLYEVTFKADGDVDVATKMGDISNNTHAWTFSGDIAISPEGVIYGFGLNSGKYEFFKVNRDGSGFEVIRSTGYTFSLQLAFSGDGTLYGHDAQAGKFFEINKSTGAITEKSDGVNLYTDTASAVMSFNFENKPPVEYNIAGYKLNYTTQEGLEGWTINLYKWDETLNEGTGGWLEDIFASDETDEFGKYCFTDLPAGKYKVEEIIDDEDHWIQREPFDTTEKIYHEVTLPEDSSDCEEGPFYNFENEELFDITAYKYRYLWEDYLGSGPDNENPLEGWTMHLDRWIEEDGVWDEDYRQSGQTGANGAYTFAGLPAGTYRVREEIPENWTAIEPDDGERIIELPGDIDTGNEIAANFWNQCYSDETAWGYSSEFSHENKDVLPSSGNWGWYIEVDTTTPTSITADLYAGAGGNDLSKGAKVGQVLINYENGYISVTFEPFEGVEFEETHVWIGATQLPLKKGVMTDAPGQFPYTDGAEVQVNGNKNYVAVHAVARIPCGWYLDIDMPE